MLLGLRPFNLPAATAWKNSSILPAGWKNISSLASPSPIFAKACGTPRGPKRLSPSFSSYITSPTLKIKFPFEHIPPFILVEMVMIGGPAGLFAHGFPHVDAAVGIFGGYFRVEGVAIEQGKAFVEAVFPGPDNKRFCCGFGLPGKYFNGSAMPAAAVRASLRKELQCMGLGSQTLPEFNYFPADAGAVNVYLSLNPQRSN
ncbi:hypothetical protein [Chitinophaga sp. 22620]|uniref:hypothetical protein n=1 Tax=Chitinophaga sp. 22620 TaxID=3453952 RepID=UPI003F8797BD